MSDSATQETLPSKIDRISAESQSGNGSKELGKDSEEGPATRSGNGTSNTAVSTNACTHGGSGSQASQRADKSVFTTSRSTWTAFATARSENNPEGPFQYSVLSGERGSSKATDAKVAGAPQLWRRFPRSLSTPWKILKISYDPQKAGETWVGVCKDQHPLGDKQVYYATVKAENMVTGKILYEHCFHHCVALECPEGRSQQEQGEQRRDTGKEWKRESGMEPISCGNVFRELTTVLEKALIEQAKHQGREP